MTALFEGLVQLLDLAGVVVIVGGAAAASLSALSAIVRRQDRMSVYRGYRAGLGRSLLLGLEILIAADIIRTVAVRPSIENVLVLGLIVLIRTFLSFSLELELEGRLPWQRLRRQLPPARRRPRASE